MTPELRAAGVLGLLAGCVGLGVLLCRRTRVRLSTLDLGLEAFRAGRYAEAAPRLEEACRRLRRHPGGHALAVSHRGLCYLRQGDLDRAAALLLAALDSRNLHRRGREGSLARVLGGLLEALAAQGRFEEAETWAEHARAAVPEAHRHALGESLAFLRLRQGRAEEALALLDLRARDPHATGEELARNRLLRAQLDPEAPAGPGDVPRALARYPYLVRVWPELGLD